MSEALISDLLPFEDHIRDDLVLMKSGGVMAMFAADGVSPDTSDDSSIAAWFDQLHGAWSNIAADDLEVIVYQCRGEADRSVYASGPCRSEFIRAFDEAYREALFAGSLYHNFTFIAVHLHAPRLQSKAPPFLRGVFNSPQVDIEQRADRLDGICALLQAQTPSFRLTRLGYKRRDKVIFDEIAEALAFATTGIWRAIPATTGRMGNAMFSERFRFRGASIEIQGAGHTSHAAMFAMREYPLETWPGMFHGLATANYRNTLVQSFRFTSNAKGLSITTRKQNKLEIAGDKAVSQQEELARAADDLISRRWVLGDHSLTLIAFADTAPALSEVSNTSWRDLAKAGLVAIQMKKALQAAFLSMFPGNAHLRPRPGYVKSRNFVAMAPLYNFPAGAATGHWGVPIATFRTMAGTPFRFHWHVADVGNTLVTGAVGSGKTMLTAFLLAMTAGRARVVALDHKRGWDLLIHRMGGDYAVLGAGEPHFAPLKALDAAPRNIEFLSELIRGLIGEPMTEEETRRLSIGLRVVMSMPAQQRCLKAVCAFFDLAPNGAGARLEKWCFGNDLGWVVDAPVDTVSFGDLNGLDVTALLENPRARGPALAYLFHRIALLLDGSPILIPIDEGWRALTDETFRAMIEKRIRTIRSMNGAVVFITQSPRDIIDSGIARILIEQCPTQFHLLNPRATREDYVDGLKLTEGQWEAFKTLRTGQGSFLLLQGTESVVATLPLHGLDSFTSILSAREADLKRMDAIRATSAVAADGSIEEGVLA